MNPELLSAELAIAGDVIVEVVTHETEAAPRPLSPAEVTPIAIEPEPVPVMTITDFPFAPFPDLGPADLELILPTDPTVTGPDRSKPSGPAGRAHNLELRSAR
jgi:hypothetical protein